MTIGCDEGVLTARYSFEDVVAKVFHEHLLLAFHILDDDVRDVVVWMLLEGVLVLHDT